MRKFLWIAGVLLLLLAVAAGSGLYLAYRASQHVPEFYDQVLHVEPQRQEQQGDQLEQQVLALHNDVAESGRWEAVFTDEQINGWLAFDLPRKFAEALPAGVSEPRVLITEEEARLACQYRSPRIQSVFSLALDVHLTEEPNVLAVRVRQARAGMLPIPLNRFLDQISQQAREADLVVRWTQTDGDPVALITVPTQHEQYPRREIHLESVELRQGALYLAGRTDQQPRPHQAWVPASGSNEQVHR